MAPVYADHPFPLMSTPQYEGKQKDANYEEDMFDRVAADMALVHNVMIRALNSIYLQAPHIQPRDEKPFAQYILQWYKLLHVHHSGEEEYFFPGVEEMTGEKGIMEANINQHHAFHDGLEALHKYVDDIVAGREKYDGQRIISLIDSFGRILADHLADEIPTLLSLRQYGLEKMADLERQINEEAQKTMKEVGVFQGLPFAFANIDLSFEDGLWKNWPPAPSVLAFFVRYVAWWVHSDWWKFSACDQQGRWKPLYAVPPTTTE